MRRAVFDYPAPTTQPILESSMVTRARAPSRFGGKRTQAVHGKGGRLAVARHIHYFTLTYYFTLTVTLSVHGNSNSTTIRSIVLLPFLGPNRC